jgi:cytoskeletal protein RodZ
MDYSTFKSLQILLFFGSAMAFCLWQLAVIRRMRREDAKANSKTQAEVSGTSPVRSEQPARSG